jgi:hypothetical protein
MGHIKEPKGIDFLISSEPLTKKDRLEISEFIRTYKAKNSTKLVAKAKRLKVLLD